MAEHPHLGRIQAVAHLSSMYALAECAIEALAEDGIFSPEEAINDARHELVRAADEITGPLGVANVLQTVEEYIANGTRIDPSDPNLDYRVRIVTAIVDSRQAALEDERGTPPEGRSRCKLCQSLDCGCVLGRPPSEWGGFKGPQTEAEHA